MSSNNIEDDTSNEYTPDFLNTKVQDEENHRQQFTNSQSLKMFTLLKPFSLSALSESIFKKTIIK